MQSIPIPLLEEVRGGAHAALRNLRGVVTSQPMSKACTVFACPHACIVIAFPAFNNGHDDNLLTADWQLETMERVRDLLACKQGRRGVISSVEYDLE